MFIFADLLMLVNGSLKIIIIKEETNKKKLNN